MSRAGGRKERPRRITIVVAGKALILRRPRGDLARQKLDRALLGSARASKKRNKWIIAPEPE